MNSVCAHSQETIGRADALARGLKRYFTGKPCKRGHVADRATVNHTCTECKSLSDARVYIKAATEIGRRIRERERLNATATKRRLRKYYEQNRDKIIERRDRWRAENQDRVRAKGRQYAANRHARSKACEGQFSSEDIERIRKAQGGRCAYCKQKLDTYDIDHIQPLARSGSNNRRNLQLTCPSCNRSKGAKDPIDFARERGMLL